MKTAANLRRMLAGVGGLHEASLFNAVSGYPLPKAHATHLGARRALANLSAAFPDQNAFVMEGG